MIVILELMVVWKGLRADLSLFVGFKLCLASERVGSSRAMVIMATRAGTGEETHFCAGL